MYIVIGENLPSENVFWVMEMHSGFLLSVISCLIFIPKTKGSLETPRINIYLNVLPAAKVTFGLGNLPFANLLPTSTTTLSRGIPLIHIWLQKQWDLVAGQRPRLLICQPKFVYSETKTSWLWVIIESELQQIRQRPWKMKPLKASQQLKR